MDVWQASFEFLNEEKEVRSSDLIFKSMNASRAVKDAARYWEGRNAVFPEHFNRLLCFKLYTYTVPIINANGSISNGPLGFGSLEWKCDTAGRAFSDWVTAQADFYARNA